MKRVLFFLVVAFAARAQEPCPWLNSATAAGFLGVPVVSTVTHDRKIKDDAVCQFGAQQASAASTLLIEVVTMVNTKQEFPSYLSKCPPNAVSLHAIGNEAVACAPEKDGKSSEQVVGRVRERAFVITLTTASKSSANRQKVRDIAELVSGNLF